MHKLLSLTFFFLFGISTSVSAFQEPISISEAREKPEGTQVTVTGHFTVTDEFRGPVYFQDQTGGIAWFDFSNMRDEFTLDIQRGDSVVVTGDIGFFNDLLQIVDATDWEFYSEGNRQVVPAEITVSEMNTGDYEGQLVAMHIDIAHSGSFQGNTNYNISDNSGAGEMRIDTNTDLVGAVAPDGVSLVVGVVGQFRGTYQLLPRDTNDMDAETFVYPGEDVSKDKTFEVATWNIEWFGSTSNGPSDEARQMENVIEVINEVDADIYALQEIASPSAFAELVNSLEGYGGILANFSQSQETAYLFKRATVDSLDSGLVTENMTQSNWANGRYPLFFHFTATINEESRQIYAFNIHAKAFDDSDSYSQRENASRELKLYLDNLHSQDHVLFIGDYNDTIIGSITSGEDSPYKNFDEDQEYTIITKKLEEKGLNSQSAGSFIDHITITSELADEYIPGTERVENVSYIGSYLSTTSDHYPIWTRFQFEPVVSNEGEFSGHPLTFTLEQNYPNPFNPTTVISYRLPINSMVDLRVFDILGREVAALVNGERQSAGSHEITFDAGNLSSGVYIYRLSASNGQQMTKKMLLVK